MRENLWEDWKDEKEGRQENGKTRRRENWEKRGR